MMDNLDQYMPLIMFCVNGLIAGWLASRLFGGLGFFRNLIIGMMGSVLAGYAIKTGTITAPPLAGSPFLDQIIYSAIGAIVILIFARLVAHR